jgi:hypothetical protein
MNAKQAIKEIKTLLGMEVKLEQARLIDGTTVIEAPSFEAGAEVFVVTEEGNVPLPVGEYEMEGGEYILVVTEEGIISEIKEKMEETEEEVTEEVATETEEEMSTEERQPKKTIESIIKETLFSEVAKMREENEALKAELNAIKTELSAQNSVKPISYNPENEKPVQVFRYEKQKAQSSLDRVLNKMNKI